MPYRVLLDGVKLLDPKTDGIKRYVWELAGALNAEAGSQWEIDVELATGYRVPLPRLAESLACRGSSLGKLVPPLLSPGPDNPLWACRAQLQRSAGSYSLGRIRDEVKCQTLRLARSSLRRWNDVRRAVKLTDTGSYDLIHLTLPNTWRRYASVRGALVVTVHDLSHLVCPEHQTDRNIASLGEGLEFARRARARYVSVSESTAGQMVDLLDVGRQSIDVILEGVDRNRFTPQVDASARQRVAERYQLSTEPFFLCLGTIEPRKNLLNTVRAFRRFASQERSSTAKLVIAGAQGWGESNALRREIAACPQISEIGYVEEEDLPTLYQMCRTFCYLSHYEGFGLPVAEAMACGAPVLFGDASSLPEVASGGGLGAAPHDVEAIAAALRRMWSDDALRARLARRALERARELDWREAARRTLRTYENCLVQPIERTRREVGRGLFEAA